MANDVDLWTIAVTMARNDLARVEESLTRALSGEANFLDDVSDTVLAVTSNALSDSATIESRQLWRVEFLCSEEPDVSALASSIRELNDSGITVKPRIQRVPDRDWVVSSQQASQPVRAGRYFVHASHYKGTKPPGAVTLIVNAGPAFGTGTHESTYGCLIALDDLAKRARIKRPLDLGAGSGILSMAVCRTWNCRVLGVDIDPRAVEFARATSLLNHLHRQVDFLVSNGCHHRRVSEKKPYDLIIANILAAPLMWMAGDIGQHLAPGGRVILSGLLRQQERRVLAPYRLNRMTLEKRIRIRGWSTLVLRGPSGARRKILHRPASRRSLPESSEVSFFERFVERRRSKCPAPILHRLSECPTAYLRWARTSAGNNGSRAQVTISRSPSRTTRVTMAGFCAPSPSIPGQNDPSAKSSKLLITNTTFPQNTAGPLGPAGSRHCTDVHIGHSRNFACAEFNTQQCVNCIPRDMQDLRPCIGTPTRNSGSVLFGGIAIRGRLTKIAIGCRPDVASRQTDVV